jgi:putative transcriptional regulator
MGQRRRNIQTAHERAGLARQTISALYNDKVKRIDDDMVVKPREAFNREVGDLLSLTTEDEIETQWVKV